MPSLAVDRQALARLGVHFIKLDVELLLAADSAAVNDLRLSLAQSGLHLVATKVATEAQASALAAGHVDLAQGNLFGSPGPSADFLSARAVAD